MLSVRQGLSLAIATPIFASYVGLLAALRLSAILVTGCLAWNHWAQRREASVKAKFLADNDLFSWPCVSGALPGNFDVLYTIGTTSRNEMPGHGFARLSEKYGSTYDLRPMGSSMVYTQDPEVVRHILATNPNNFVKGQFLNELFDDVLGTGIFNSDGERWRSHRQAARPFFQKENLTNFIIFEKHSNILIDAVKRLSQSSSGHEAIDFHELASRFTLDAASDFLFGASINSLLSVSKEDSDPEYLAAFQRVQRRLAGRLTAGSMWKWVERGSGMRDDMAVVNGLVDMAVERAMESQEGTYHGFTTLLELLTRNEPSMGAKEKRDELLNVMMAARDTTASLMASVMYELASNPDIQELARQEVLDFVGQDDYVSFQDVKNLKVMRAVINESLRMYPPISANSRVAVEDDIIVTSGRRYFVPAGTHIACGVFQMQRRCDLWGPDASQWRPQRWLDGKGIPSVNTFAFQAWGVGPRICIGQELAYLETTYLVSRFLQSFKSFELATDAQPHDSWIHGKIGHRLMPEAPVVTLTLRGGVWLTFKE